MEIVILFMQKMQQITSSLILLTELIFIEERKKLKQNLRFHKEQILVQKQVIPHVTTKVSATWSRKDKGLAFTAP